MIDASRTRNSRRWLCGSIARFCCFGAVILAFVACSASDGGAASTDAEDATAVELVEDTGHRTDETSIVDVDVMMMDTTDTIDAAFAECPTSGALSQSQAEELKGEGCGTEDERCGYHEYCDCYYWCDCKNGEWICDSLCDDSCWEDAGPD